MQILLECCKSYLSSFGLRLAFNISIYRRLSETRSLWETFDMLELTFCHKRERCHPLERHYNNISFSTCLYDVLSLVITCFFKAAARATLRRPPGIGLNISQVHLLTISNWMESEIIWTFGRCRSDDSWNKYSLHSAVSGDGCRCRSEDLP